MQAHCHTVITSVGHLNMLMLLVTRGLFLLEQVTMSAVKKRHTVFPTTQQRLQSLHPLSHLTSLGRSLHSTYSGIKCYNWLFLIPIPANLPDPLPLQWLISQNSFHPLLNSPHPVATLHFGEKLVSWLSFGDFLSALIAEWKYKMVVLKTALGLWGTTLGYKSSQLSMRGRKLQHATYLPRHRHKVDSYSFRLDVSPSLLRPTVSYLAVFNVPGLIKIAPH